jgi:hypothetical protein
MTVPIKTWHTSCTCPGSERERQTLHDAGVEIRDFAEVLNKAQQRSRARRQAFEATRASAAGKTKAQIRQIYAAELLARGLTVPTECILDAVADRIHGNPLPAARILIESMVQIGKGFYKLSRLFGSAGQGPQSTPPPEGDLRDDSP